MQARGLEADHGDGRQPRGLRSLPAPRRPPTVLIYCHYDVKPAPPAGLAPALAVRAGPPGRHRRGGRARRWPWPPCADEPLPEHRLYGRGASDDKGPIWAHLTALELMRAHGIAPRVAVKFIFDGEEEMGSPHFGPFTEQHRDLLAADLVLVMDGPKDASGRPTVAFGARGILSLELTLESARRDVHSGNFSVPNPGWRLVGLLASMAAPDGTPLVEGLEDGVVPPTPAERELMGRIPLDRAASRRSWASRCLRTIWSASCSAPRSPSAVSQSGFTGPEAQTIIPHQATVAFDARLVKNQRVETVYRRILDHIRAQGFTVIESADAPIPDELRGRAVRVVERRGYDPAKTSADLPISRQVIEAVERAHGGEPAVVLADHGRQRAPLGLHRHPAAADHRGAVRQRQQPPAQPQRAPAPGPPLPGRADYCAPAPRSRLALARVVASGGRGGSGGAALHLVRHRRAAGPAGQLASSGTC